MSFIGFAHGGNPAQPHADSYWAASTRYSCSLPRLEGPMAADVAIIGAGFTGLSAAYHLNRLGYSCIVIEANEVGWGASGRNGGMAVPRYKLTFPELESKYGLPTALTMYRLAHDAVDTVERLVKEESLDCDFSRWGHVTPMISGTDVARFERDIDWLRRHVGDTTPTMKGRAEVERLIGSAVYNAGYHEPRGAGIHPLKYCMTLANALARRGVGIFTRSAVTYWKSDGQSVHLQTARGTVAARSLIIATNAYTDQTSAGRQLKRRVIPIASTLLATSALSAALRKTVLPGGQLVTDAKRLTNYYRVMPDGTFLFGGRGGASTSPSRKVYARLQRDMRSVFPDLADVPIIHRWFGLVAVTLDSLPHIGKLETNVHFAMGYNGRGVALATLLGRELADRVAGTSRSMGPIDTGKFSSIPFHSLRVPAKQIAISSKQLADAIDLKLNRAIKRREQ